MSDWSWVRHPGNRGDLPVRILPDSRAEPVLDAIEGTLVTDFRNQTEENLVVGDICILRAEIATVSEPSDRTLIEIDVSDVEYIRKADRDASAVAEMMQHLDGARERRREQAVEEGCENCREISRDTRLTIKTEMWGREFHHCARCERFLATHEYERWAELNRG